MEQITQTFNNNFFNLIIQNQKEEIELLLNEIKNGDTIDWEKKDPLFSKNFKYRAVRFSPFYSAGSEVTSIELLLEDIRAGAKDNLKMSNINFEFLFNSAKDAIFVTDIEGNFIEVNQTAISRTGFSREAFLKLNIKNTPIITANQTFINYFQELIVFDESTALINYKSETGNVVETEISGRKINYNGQEAVLHVSREISTRNKKFAEDLESLIQWEERERSMFAHEINDILGPNLSLVKMYTDLYFETAGDKQRDEIASLIRTSIDNSINSITKISNKISPHILKNLGLKIALEAYIKNLRENSKIKFIFSFNMPDIFSNSDEIILYRAITQLLNNAVEHSKADVISLVASIKNGNIWFDIHDDGIGFDVEEILSNEKNKGITNIISKINSIRGNVVIKSEAGVGTSVKIELTRDDRKKN